MLMAANRTNVMTPIEGPVWWSAKKIGDVIYVMKNNATGNHVLQTCL